MIETNYTIGITENQFTMSNEIEIKKTQIERPQDYEQLRPNLDVMG